MLPRPSRLLDRHLPLHSGQSLHPASTSHLGGLCFTRHRRGFKQLTRPVFPSPVAARIERAALGLSPGLRTPPTRSRRGTPGWGQAIEYGPGTTRSTSHQSILQSCSSLTTCDLASHDDEQERGLAVLLLDASRSGAGADRVPADSSLSSRASVYSVISEMLATRRKQQRAGPLAGRVAGGVWLPCRGRPPPERDCTYSAARVRKALTSSRNTAAAEAVADRVRGGRDRHSEGGFSRG